MLLLLTSVMLSAQSYTSLWKKVHEAEDKYQPKSALTYIQKIERKAEREQSYGNLLAALMKELYMQREVSDDSLKAAKQRLANRRQAWLSDGHGVEATLAEVACRSLQFTVYSSQLDSLLASPDSALYRKAGKTAEYAPFIVKGEDSRYFNNDLLSLIILANDQGEKTTDLLEKYYGKENKVVAWRRTLEAINKEKDTSRKIALIDSALIEWKGWKEINTLANLRNELTKPQFNAGTEKRIYSTQDSVKIAFGNVRNVNAVKVTLRSDRGETRTATQKFRLANAWDIIERSKDTLNIGTLPLGKWTISITDDKGEIKRLADTLYVTDLRVILQELPKKEKRIVVVDATTGKEITDAKVHRDGNYYYATKGVDTAMPKQWINTYFSLSKSQAVQNYLDIFTDRTIYRRGQTVHVSVISHAVLKGTETLPNVDERVTVSLYDNKGKEVAQKSIVTDVYGTATADFTIPDEGINGNYRITAKGSASGSIAVSVEDYKRPSFYVNVNGNVNDNVNSDTVIVVGSAKMYSGVPVANARVVYDVKRNNGWWIGSRNNEVLAHDTIYTDADGAFVVKMPTTLPADVDTTWYYCYRYTLTATVMDDAGESHSQSLTKTRKNDRPIKPTEPEKPKPVSTSAENFGEKGEVVITLRDVNSSNFGKETYAFYTLCSGETVQEKSMIEFTDSTTYTLYYKEEYGDGVTFSVAWVKNGEMVSDQVQVKKYLPTKKLTMEWGTFRNKMYPGQTETWTLKVKNHDGTPSKAQVMAVMYDKSLDAIKKHDCRFADRRRLSLPSMMWRTGYEGNCWFRGSKELKYLEEKPLAFNHIEDEFTFVYVGRTSLGRLVYKSRGAISNMKVFDYVESAPMMMSAKATAIGAFDVAGDENVVVGYAPDVDNGGAEPELQMRSDFSETALFIPQVLTDRDGVATLKFIMPESVTTWRFMALAHDKEMRYALMDTTAITQKKVMVQAKMPRFLRVGDKATVSATVANMMEKSQTMNVRFFVKDAETEKTVYRTSKKVTAQAGKTEAVTFAYNVKEKGDLICGFTAEVPGFSDGEQYLLPVLTEEELKEDTATIVVNPKEMMMEALPELRVPKSCNAINLANAIYANVMTAKLKGIDVSAANDNVLVQLINLQNGDGGFSWYGGMRSSKYITIEVLKTLARLNLLCGKQGNTEYMMDKAFVYAAKQMEQEMRDLKKYNVKYLSSTALDWLYTLAISNKSGGAAESFFRKMIYEETKHDDMQTKAVAAITLNENGKQKKAEEFAESIKQHTVYRADIGRYFDSYRAAYSWCDYRIPTHTMCVEALENVTPQDGQTISEMLRWLVSAKRTQRWDNPINAVNAIYALYNAKDTTVMSTYTVNPADLKGALKVKREVIGEMKIGDKVKVKLTIEADRDYDFVTVTDNRPACFEPVNQLSGYRWGSRWGYYAEMRDSKSIYHFDQMAKGTHVVETEYYVNRSGEYQTGNATVVCEYAPEFRGSVDAMTIRTK